MKAILTLLSHILIVGLLQCQPISPFFHGPVTLSQGNIRSFPDGPQAMYNNPAGIETCPKTTFNLSMENRFELTELTAGQLAATRKFGRYGTVGFKLIQFGSSGYIDQTMGIGYARKLFEFLTIGVAFDLLHLRIAEYGSRSLFTAEIGLVSQLSDDITLSVHLFNPQGSSFKAERSLPMVMTLGLQYCVSSRLWVLTEVEKNSYLPVQLKAAIRYRMLDKLFLTTGVFTSSHSANLTGGIQLKWKEFAHIDLGISLHQYLGLNSSIGLDLYLDR